MARLDSYELADPLGGGAVVGHNRSAAGVRFDPAALLGAGGAARAALGRTQVLASTLNGPAAAIAMAGEMQRIATVAGGEPDLVLSPVGGAYWGRDVGVVSGDLGAWAASLGGSFPRPSIATYLGPTGTTLMAAAGVARHEFDASGQRIGALFEPSRTKAALQSDDISMSPWTIGANASVLGVAATAPDGGAARLLRMSAASAAYVAQSGIAATAGVTYRFSVRLMLVDGGDSLTTSNIAMDVPGASGAAQRSTANVTLVRGVWQRVSITATAGASGTITIYPIYNCAGYTVAVWDAQLEAGHSDTSRLPTTTAPVTRAADSLSVPLITPGLFAPGGGTMMAELMAASIPNRVEADYATISILADGTYNNRWTAGFQSQAGVLHARADITTGGVYVGGGDAVVPVGQPARAVLRWQAGAGLAYSCNGSAAAVVSGAVAPTPTTPTIALSASFAFYVRRLVYFRRALSSAQLAALSSLSW
ncbi:phage head spike fiber domain-containing protein [Segnochrobactrum spirostomi]|uniref:CBM-cenC domain-containing protein n=1 Tax=Segnochrobactrum spirostomi TaxID=2608987 RepID=A0A6A7Y6E5_9HYPH|nr:hypothetical protein [Segnochrobactrum spirostomi]MQT14376.1 hypothetical protein [Segnochrobactrum spirostomi]